MKKSVLILGLFGINTLLCTSALANPSTYCKPGFYAGVEAGVGDTHYKGSDVFGEINTAFNNEVASITNNFEFPDYFVSPGFTDGSVEKTGAAGRIYAGYQFNPYFALETGYTQFNKTVFTASGSVLVYTDEGGPTRVNNPSPPSSNYVLTNTYYNSYSGEITEHAIDLVAKLTYPLQYGFGVFLKGGLAYIAADRHINQISSINEVYPQTASTTIENTFYTKSYQAVRPTYGVGIDYTIPQTPVDLDLSYTEISGGGGIPKASLASLGISVKFA